MGHNKSNLNGFMEIAGKSAELVIANQNGISCNGCGFINTTRGTLTTGKSVFDSSGKLQGFDVAEGHIDITGDGLNASNMDEVDLLARSVSLNSKLWAKKLDIVTGANRVNYQDNTTSALPGTSSSKTSPTFALDVAAIGGMYANRILLVGTDKGLGVNLNGEVSATQSMVLNTQGDLINQNKLTAKSLSVTSAQTITNTGSVLGDSIALKANTLDNRTDKASIQATDVLSLQTQAAMNNLDGAKILSKTGQVSVQTDGLINQSSIAANRLNIQAHTVQNSTQNGTLYGIDNLSLNVSGQTQNTDKGLLHSDNELTLNSQELTNSADIESMNDALINGQQLVNSGTIHVQNGALTLQSNQLDNQGMVVGKGITLTSNTLHNHTANGQIFSTDRADFTLTGDVTNINGALIHADKDLTLSTTGDITNTASTIEAVNDLDATSQNLANTGAVLAKNGALTLQTGNVDNQGKLAGTGIALNANTLNNSTTNGQITSVGQADFTITGDVTNTNGALIHADKYLTLNATGDLTNTDSTIEAVDSLNAKSQNLTNTGSVLAKNGALTLQTGKVDNQGSLAGNGISIKANTLKNSTTNGKIVSADQADLTIAGDVINTDGALVHADKDLTLNTTGDVTNTASTIEAVNGLDAKSQNLTSTGSVLAKNGVLTLQTGKVDNQGSLAGNGISIKANTLKNSTTNGQIISTDQADLTIAGNVINTDGALIHTDKDLTLNAMGDLTNTGSTAEAVNGLNATSQNLTNTGSLLAQKGPLTIHTNTVDNQGALTGNDITVRAKALNNTTDKGRIVSKSALRLTTDKDIVNSKGAIIHAATDLTVEGKGNITNANATIEAIGKANVTTHTLTNSGGILAQQGALTANTSSVDNQGLLTGKGITLSTSQLNNTTKQGQIISADNADLTIAGNVTNTDGALIHADKDLALNATGDLSNTAATIEAVNSTRFDSKNLTNTGSVLAQNGNVTIKTGQVDNQGTLAGKGLTLHADQLNNHTANGKLISTAQADVTLAGDVTNADGALIHADKNLTLNAMGDLTNTASTIEAAGTSQITSQNLSNSGTIQAHNDTLTINSGLIDNQGSLKGNGLLLKANGLNNSTANGQIISTDKADVTIAGDVTNTDGALIHTDKDLTLNATGDLTNTASTIEAVNGLDAKSQNLTNSGTVLAQNSTLTVNTSSLDNQDTLAGNGIAITADALNNHSKTAQIFSTGDLTLTIEKGIKNAEHALIHAANNLTLTSKDDLSNDASTIEAVGTSQVTSQNVTNSGSILAQNGALTINTHSVDSQGTLAGHGVTLKANTLKNSTANGQIVSTDGADLTIAGDVTNTDSALIHADQDLTLNATGDLTNTASTIEAVNGLDAKSQNLTNSGTVLAQKGALTVHTSNVANQGVLAGNGIAITAGSLNNHSKTAQVFSTGDLALNSQGNVTNTGSLTAKNGILTINSGLINNQGLLTSNGIILSAHGLSNSTAEGQIISTDKADVTIAGDITNTGGALIHTDKDLTLNATGDLTNTASTIEAVNGLDSKSQNLTNSGTVLAQKGALTVNTSSLDNQGTLAGNGIAITADSLNNHSKTAQIFSTGDLTLAIEKGIENAKNALIHAANNLTLTSKDDLSNDTSTIEAAGTNQITSQNVTNTGKVLAQNGALTINTNVIDSQGTLAGHGVTLKANTLKNSTANGQIVSTDKVDLTIAGDVTNTDGALIHADKALNLNATGDLTNTASTIEAVNGLDAKSQNLTNSGTVLAQNGTLTVNTSSLDNQGGLAGNGIAITADSLNNQSKTAQLFSTGNLTLNSQGNVTNTGSLTAKNGILTINSGLIDNQGLLTSNGIILSAHGLSNSTTEGQIISTDKADLTIAGDVTNTNGALIHTDKSLTLNATGDLTNTASSIEAVNGLDGTSQNLTNSGTLLAQKGALTVNTSNVANQGVLAGNGIAITADSFSNHSKTAQVFSTGDLTLAIEKGIENAESALIHAANNLTLTSKDDLTNDASTIEAAGTSQITSQNVTNTGTVLAQNGALTINTNIIDSQGTLAGHGVTLKANTLKNSTANGQIVSTDQADLTIAGDVTNTDGALIHTDKDLTLNATGDLTNTASTIEAVNGLDAKSQNLTNSGTVLAQNGVLTIQTSKVNNKGVLSGKGIAINADQLNNRTESAKIISTDNLTLTVVGTVSNLYHSLIHAASNLILKSDGDLNNTVSTIEAAGSNQINSQNVTNTGSLIAQQGGLSIDTHSIDNQGNIAGHGITLKANTLNNSTAAGQIVSTDQADLSTTGDVTNTGGALIHADKVLTLKAGGDVYNTDSTVESVNALASNSQNLINTGTLLAQDNALVINTHNLDSQGILAGKGISLKADFLNNHSQNAQIFSMGDIDLAIGKSIVNDNKALIHADNNLTLKSQGNLTNTASTIEAAGTSQITSQNVTNTGTLLAQNGILSVDTDLIDSQGTLAGHGIDLHANTLSNRTETGNIVSSDKADLSIAGDITNTGGALIHADKDLLIDAQGEVINSHSTIEALNGLDAKSQNLVNSGTVLAQNGALTVKASKVDNQGVLAGNGIAINADFLNNHSKTAQVFSIGDLALTIEKDIDNDNKALIHAAHNLTLKSQGDLTNTDSTVEAVGSSQITSRNVTNTGIVLAQNGPLIVSTGLIDNQGSLTGNGVILNANGLNNSTANGQVISTDNADVSTKGDVINTGGALVHADKKLTLNVTGDLTNTASTIEAVNGLDAKSLNLTNSGSILAQDSALNIKTNKVDNQGALVGKGMTVKANELSNRKANSKIISTDQADFTVAGDMINSGGALIHTDKDLTLNAIGDLTNTASTIEAAGTNQITSQNVTNTGKVLAQNGTLTINTNAIDSQGTLAGHGVTLKANALKNSTAAGQIVSTDKANLTIAGDVTNIDGALIHADKDLSLNSVGGLTNTASTIEAVNGLDTKNQNLTNSGTVLAQNGALTIQTNQVDNQGALVGNGIAITADSLNNQSKTAQVFSTGDLTLTIEKGIENAKNALIHAANNLTLTSKEDFTNDASTIEAAGTNQITSQNVTNTGKVLAQNGALTIHTNAIESQGTLAGHGITLKANALKNSTANGQIVSTDGANLTIAGNITNSDGALIHADKGLNLNATGDLTNTASTIEAVNGLDAKSQNLTNSGTLLAQKGALTVNTNNVANQGVLAGNGIAITADSLNNHSKTAQVFSTGDLTLTIEKGIVNAKNALIHAANNLTLTSKDDLTNDASTIEAAGTNQITSQNVTNTGKVLAQNGALTINTKAIESQGTLAGHGVTLKANTLKNSTANGQIVSTDQADLTIAGDVTNTDGALIHADKDLTLNATGDLTNTASTIEAVNGLDAKSQNLTNSGTVLAQNGVLTIQTSQVDNQGGLAGNGIAITADALNNHSKTAQTFSTGDLTLTIKKGIKNAEHALIHAANNLTLTSKDDLSNDASTIEAAGTSQITSQNVINSGSILAQNGALTINTNAIDSQGTLAGHGVTLKANTLKNSTTNGQIVSTDKADLTIAGGVTNTDGALIHADQDLTLNATGDVTNTASTIEAVNGLNAKSQNLTNSGTVLAQKGGLTVNTSNVANQGVLAGNGIAITADSLNNQSKTAQVFSTDKADFTIAGDVTNTDGALIHAGKDLSLNATGDLTNTGSTIEAVNDLDTKSQNLTNSGTVLAQNGALTIQNSQVDNQGVLAGNGIAITADSLNNHSKAAQLFSTGDLTLTIEKGIVNAENALIHAANDLNLTSQGDLTNTAATIETAGANQIKSQNLVNTGTILAQNNALNVSTNQVDNQGTLAGNGIVLNANELKNSTASGKLFSTDKVDLTIAGVVTNADGALIHADKDLKLNTTRDLTNAASTIEAVNGLNAKSQNLTNSGTVLAQKGGLTVNTSNVDNQGVLAGNGIAVTADSLNNHSKAAQVFSTGDLTLTIEKGIVNAKNALIHAANNLTLTSKDDLTNDASTIEAAGTNQITSQNVTNTGKVLAQNGALTINTKAIESQGTLAGHSVTLKANTLKNSTANGQIVSTDKADLSIAGDVANTNGALIHAGKDLTLNATGDLTNTASTIEAVNGLDAKSQNLTNSGTLLAQKGGLTVNTSNVANQGVLAGNGIAITADSLNNQSKTAQVFSTDKADFTIAGDVTNTDGALIHAGKDLSLNATGDLTNTASTIEAINGLGVKSQNLTNTGTVLAQNNALTVSTHKVDNQGVLAGNGIVLNANEFKNSTASGKLFSTDKADVTISGDITNTDGALIHAGKDLTLNATGDLTNTASTIEAVNGLNAKSQNLTNSGTVLAQKGGLTVNTSNVANQGVLAGNGIAITADSLNNQSKTAQIFSTGDLTLTIEKGIENAKNALIHAANNLTLTSQEDLANTDSASIEVAGSSQITSQNVTNIGTVLAQNGALTINTNVIDSEGTLAGHGISLKANTLKNSTASGQIVSTDKADLTIAGDVTNTGGALIHADKDLTLNATGDLTNTASTIEAVNGLDTKSQNLTNSGTLLAQNGALTVNTSKVDNQGALTGKGISINAGQLTNSTANGKIFSTGLMGLTSAGDVTNTDGGLVHANDALTVTSSKGNVVNTNATIESADQASIKSQTLTNSGTVLAKNGALTIGTNGITNQGLLAGHGMTIDTGVLDNATSASKLYSSQDLTLNTTGAVNNTHGGLIHADNTLTLTATGDINNTNSRIESGTNSTLTSQNVLNGSGSRILAANGALTIHTNTLNNQGALLGQGLSATASVINNTTAASTIASTQDLTLNTTQGNVTNSNGAKIQANGALTIQTANDLVNTGASIESTHNIALSSRHLNNSSNAVIRANDSIGLHWIDSLVNSGSKIEAKNNIRTTQNSGNLTNNSSGLITAENGTLGMTFGSLNNQGGIAGNLVALQTNHVSNDGGNALIMAKTKLDVRSGSDFNNTNGGAFYSFGTGYLESAGTLTNSSSTIETNGDLSIKSGRLINKRQFISIGNNSTSKSYEEVGKKKVSWLPTEGDFQKVTEQTTKKYTRTIVTPYILKSSSQGQILSGGSISLEGKIDNLYSTISARQKLTYKGSINNQAFTANKTVTTKGADYYVRVESSYDVDSHGGDNSHSVPGGPIEKQPLFLIPQQRKLL